MYLATLRETPVTFLALCLIAIGYLARTIVLNISYRRKYRFPNEVPGLPLVGNSFQMPATGQGPYIKALADKYGEMYVPTFARECHSLLRNELWRVVICLTVTTGSR